ncbi:glycoside hydrolase family 79 protein [Mycena leptocephala]|nr:glycoside hydrolase family 79 protein [Mycena leptocephala]
MFQLFWVALIVPLVSGITVSIPLRVPQGAPAVGGNLFSLSIEQDGWLDWAGNTSRNSFFFNTLDNLVALTGYDPVLRIGADSEDRTTFNPSVQFVQQVFPPPTTIVPYPEAAEVVAGPGYFQVSTGITWGVNFGGDNLTATFLETQAIVDAFNSPALRNARITLDFLELGNEADFYNANGDRAARAFALSSHSTTGFSPQGLFANNILDSEPGRFINTISQHHYSGSFCEGSGGLLQDLMTKATIRSNLSDFIPDIQATQERNLDYVLGETNSYACHGAPGVSNTAGAALWTAIFTIFRSQLGISKVFFHAGIGYKYNLANGSTLAVPQQPHVQPQYYAAIVAAEAIGHSGQTQATELIIDDARISGYAFYERGALKRAVFINSLAFLQGATNRTSTHLDLSFSGTGTKPTAFSVKRLVIGHADDVSGLKWGGQTYETGDARVAGTFIPERGTVAVGIEIPATQAVLIAFH